MKSYTITVNGTPYNVTVEENAAAPNAPVQAAPVIRTAPEVAAPPAQAGGTKIEAPMPGTILDIRTQVGASVKEGEVLCILEAMKMENDIVASRDGTVASINVAKGESVDAGQTIITLD